jgi:hypothetical protein
VGFSGWPTASTEQFETRDWPLSQFGGKSGFAAMATAIRYFFEANRDSPALII